MQAEIPIVVTRNNRIREEHIFRNPEHGLLSKYKKRNPTAPKLRHHEQTKKHQTLDPDEKAVRSRRISSSAASRRFPKDFFREEVLLNPIKSNKTQHKQYQPCMLDTFSHKNFIVAQGEYLQMEN